MFRGDFFGSSHGSELNVKVGQFYLTINKCRIFNIFYSSSTLKICLGEIFSEVHNHKIRLFASQIACKCRIFNIFYSSSTLKICLGEIFSEVHSYFSFHIFLVPIQYHCIFSLLCVVPVACRLVCYSQNNFLLTCLSTYGNYNVQAIFLQEKVLWY